MSKPDATTKKILLAAKNADWEQVMLNGGPPCFRFEEGRFCLRAKRWHDETGKVSGWEYVPLDQLLKDYGNKRVAESMDAALKLADAVLVTHSHTYGNGRLYMCECNLCHLARRVKEAAK